jgi:hypothetical protein
VHGSYCSPIGSYVRALHYLFQVQLVHGLRNIHDAWHERCARVQPHNYPNMRLHALTLPVSAACSRVLAGIAFACAFISTLLGQVFRVFLSP